MRSVQWVDLIRVDPAVLDELAAGATAPRTDWEIDGWQVRANPDLPFRRSSCVVPLPGDRSRVHDVAERVARVEAFYRARGLATRFQVSPACWPTDLDAVLAARGYAVEAPVEYLVAPATEPARGERASGVDVRVAGIDDGWIEAYGEAGDEADGVARRRMVGYRQLLGSLSHPSIVVHAAIEGAPAGVGFGVAQGEWMGVFGMATAPSRRRQGVARTLLAALAGAALDLGVTSLYLQVERDNAPAKELYGSAGFESASRYHYRTLDSTLRPAASS